VTIDSTLSKPRLTLACTRNSKSREPTGSVTIIHHTLRLIIQHRLAYPFQRSPERFVPQAPSCGRARAVELSKITWTPTIFHTDGWGLTIGQGTLGRKPPTIRRRTLRDWGRKCVARSYIWMKCASNNVKEGDRTRNLTFPSARTSVAL